MGWPEVGAGDVIEFVAIYSASVIATVYIFYGALFGEWRKSFDGYTNAPVALGVFALMPPILLVAAVGRMLFYLAFDWDWPLRVRHNGKRERDMPTITGGGGGAYYTITTPGSGYMSTPTVSITTGIVSAAHGHVRDLAYGNEFGWRSWLWEPNQKLLFSPSQGTPWYGSELRVTHWDESDVVRGKSGIHAEFVPVDWENQVSAYAPMAQIFVSTLPPGSPGETMSMNIGYGSYALVCDGFQWCEPSSGAVYPFGTQFASPIQRSPQTNAIHGIVERFGKYVMGTDGWRAEWVIIRKLYAPDTETGLALEAAYPDVEVIYPKEN